MKIRNRRFLRENAKNLKENSEIKKKTMKEIKIVCGKRQNLGILKRKKGVF